MCVYLDHIVVTGPTEQDHRQNLDAVLTRLEEAGMQLKLKKCEFMQPDVEYLGHHISAEGLWPTKEKVCAISEAPIQQDVSQLRAYLGLIKYYIMPILWDNCQTLQRPSTRLLEKKTWGCHNNMRLTWPKAK